MDNTSSSTPLPDPTGAVERLTYPRDAMINRTEAEWEALEDAIMTVISFAEGQTLAASDVAALHLVDKCHREDDETATDAYNRGYEDGLRERGGDDLVNASRRADDAMIARSTERAMRILAEARATQAEAREKAAIEALEVIAGGDGFADVIARQTLDHIRGLPEPPRQALEGRPSHFAGRTGRCPTCGEPWVGRHCRCDEDWFFDADGRP